MSTSEPGEDKEIMHSMCDINDPCGPECFKPVRWAETRQIPPVVRLTEEEKRDGFSLGPGESRTVEVRFDLPTTDNLRIYEGGSIGEPARPREAKAEMTQKVWVEPSASIGDRRGKFPWGIALLGLVFLALVGFSLWYAISEIAAR